MGEVQKTNRKIIMPEDKNVTKFTDLVRIVITRLSESWEAGEADISVEIRNDKGERKAKVMGGKVERI